MKYSGLSQWKSRGALAPTTEITYIYMFSDPDPSADSLIASSISQIH